MIKRHSKYVSRETFLLCLFLTHKFRKIELPYFNSSSISIIILLFCDFVIRQE